ncbi:MAG: hypothetical protein AB1801_02225 [Chloroflexota bacterium]
MNEQLDQLYELLPVVYRQRDAEQGYPLRGLLRVIAEQVEVVEEDITRLYENWFIETCQDWIVPYVGDLVGYRLVHEAGEPGEVTTPQEQLRNKILIPRREVANTIHYRRRKGALALLEILANQVAGWPVRAVEFYKLLGINQSLNHLRLEQGRTVDLRQGDALDRLDGPFDELAHTVDVRPVISKNGPVGRYNLPSVGVFVWRLRVYPVTMGQAYCMEDIAGDHCFTFSVLGNDVPLYVHARPEADPTQIAGEANLPIPIRRRAFEDRPEQFYGEGKSIQIWKGVEEATKVIPQIIPPDKIIPANLKDWQYYPSGDKVAVDPVLGRIAFNPDKLPNGVWVSYNYGFSADIGGGEYDRSVEPTELSPRAAQTVFFRVGVKEPLDTINKALEQWYLIRTDQPHAVIEIMDNEVYSEQLSLVLKAGESLQIRAANRTRPVIYLTDRQRHRPDSLKVISQSAHSFTLDGLLITGRDVHIEGDLNEVNIRHCTLVPGWELYFQSWRSRRQVGPSLEIRKSRARFNIEHSILGSIQVFQDEVKADPTPINISDSIVDATNLDLEAVGGVGEALAHAILTIQRSTMLGQVQTHAIKLGEDTIFNGRVLVARRQLGCLRFCYVPPGSRTPRRYNCQPDLMDKRLEERKKIETRSDKEWEQIKTGERVRVQPQFNIQYGAPTYCQLAPTCAEEIKRGASDEAEMGVFHDLYQPQRAANLQARLDEYTPAGMEAGIIYVS